MHPHKCISVSRVGIGAGNPSKWLENQCLQTKVKRQKSNLSMGFASLGVKSSTYDVAVLDNDTSHHWVRRSEAECLSCKLNAHADILRISLSGTFWKRRSNSKA